MGWTLPSRWWPRARCSCARGGASPAGPSRSRRCPPATATRAPQVRVETSSPDGKPLVYEVAVELSGTVEFIKCVGREDEGTEEEAQYTVARVEKVR